MTIDFGFSETIKGFMADNEARCLYDTALTASAMGPCLEIGSYCGKSAYFIGLACRENGSVLYSIDHHRGSEEQQPGQEYFDPDLYDSSYGVINTFEFFRQTIKQAGLDETVIPVVTSSATAGKMWATPIAMLFIDGGHTFEAAFNDYQTWAGHIVSGGFLVIHDIFMDPAAGGQAPRQIYEMALDSHQYQTMGLTGTLGVLRKIQ
ncbi:conserved hypothetical protein [Desulfamplus magnetovallimortis]|uniref:Secreted protein n=1 Tax=Desulfamplus magnetovallimortis TaxID=1246637 RepID=A0A1W1H4Z0_9BACT|nr:class I SAM-dependent methyltransferase [Desulfamplus magnetovallimortis]SLM27445.1 conserved hypothetical protein [Desulfamplus magnetovallimortis]